MTASYVHLVGAEQVQSAARTISHASDQISSAASTIDSAASQLIPALTAATDAMNRLAAALERSIGSSDIEDAPKGCPIVGGSCEDRERCLRDGCIKAGS